MVSHDDDTARSLLNRWGTTVSLIRYGALQIGVDGIGVQRPLAFSYANRCECGKHGIFKDEVPQLPTELHSVAQYR